VMSPDSEFFNYLRSDQGAAANRAKAEQQAPSVSVGSRMALHRVLPTDAGAELFVVAEADGPFGIQRR
ncbi:MAG: hypothetical protein AAF556_08915, partial [Pseudomonadota bacterium]